MLDGFERVGAVHVGAFKHLLSLNLLIMLHRGLNTLRIFQVA